MSGPSGSGKSTVIERLLAAKQWPLHLSVSATTRAPRRGEIDGVHYHFWTPERFDAEVQARGFLEWARVHGKCYGTLRREVEGRREHGEGVILDIDVQGAEQVRKQCPDAVTVFLRAPDFATGEQRLRERHTESEEAIQRRLAGARAELERASEYDYQVVNDDLGAAVARLSEIVAEQFDKGDGNAG
ncbi:MAG TPA: guanylate kinase [Gemmataceae bacterium]|nr:guanylate kinase [Gemmataceae bacterium]